jgi:hypothetical protein
MTTASSLVDKRELTALIREIGSYLEAVETFRREGCAPRWRPELTSSPSTQRPLAPR